MPTIPDPAPWAAIYGSPVACLVLLTIGILYFYRRDLAQASARVESDKEAARRESECVARVRALEQRHVDYLETKGDQMTAALVRNTQAHDALGGNLQVLATQLASNTKATETQTAALARATITHA